MREMWWLAFVITELILGLILLWNVVGIVVVLKYLISVATYNKGGLARIEILGKLGTSPGQQCVTAMKTFDETWFKKSGISDSRN